MTEHRHRLAFIGLLVVTAGLMAGCAPGNPRFTEADPAGFFYGLWHGFIVIIAFIVSLFSDQTTIYELNNTGSWYNFGFVLGVL
ncbi:MAG: hypothetical protein QNJ97_21240 [Myxococcota bacterium]|nr:hypothetical protein [Myxococcota bacterium]